jgi:hypothetical protein
MSASKLTMIWFLDDAVYEKMLSVSSRANEFVWIISPCVSLVYIDRKDYRNTDAHLYTNVCFKIDHELVSRCCSP